MDRQEIKFLLNYLENHPENLNSLQHDFIVALKNHYNATGVLTKRQVECLYEIKEYVPSLVLKESVRESESYKYQAQYSSVDYLTSYKI